MESKWYVPATSNEPEQTVKYEKVPAERRNYNFYDPDTFFHFTAADILARRAAPALDKQWNEE